MSAIVIQVKNKGDIPGIFFDSMDPFDVRLFSDGDELLPVIRMAFTLGSGECGIKCPAHWQDKSDQTGKFTSYDIWCAGLSRDTFACVSDDLHWYEDLLRRSLS